MVGFHGWSERLLRAPEGTAQRGQDILQAAFGTFAPQSDPDAAAKFALAAIGRGRGLQMTGLVHLLTEDARIGELEGDPGWSLQRRDRSNTMPGYAAWPDEARYRAFVDPSQYALAVPERYYDRASFHALVGKMVDVFAQTHPEASDVVQSVRAALV
jgi:hypothetical protein